MAIAADIPENPAAAKRNECRAAGVAYGAHALRDGNSSCRATRVLALQLPTRRTQTGQLFTSD
jgi:hypothetical protein